MNSSRVVSTADQAPRPTWTVERLSHALFLLFSPRLMPKAAPPPDELAPFEVAEISRRKGSGSLSATWFPAVGPPRGTVLMVHPWLPWGRAYFHRHQRLPMLRAAGYHALTFDFPGFGVSGPAAGYFDRDIEDALDHVASRFPALPHHVWGVSAGGYWAHLALSRRPGVETALFEDVTPHLLEWSWRNAPRGRPAYLLFRYLFPSAYRFLDLRRHAPHLHRSRVGYIGGEEDSTLVLEETEQLARAAQAPCLRVPGARHLEAVKVAPDAVLDFALDIFSTISR